MDLFIQHLGRCGGEWKIDWCMTTKPTVSERELQTLNPDEKGKWSLKIVYLILCKSFFQFVDADLS